MTPPSAAAGGGPWKLRIENTGDVPVRLAADARLLVLEVTPPAGTVLEANDAKKRLASKKAPEAVTVRCALPDDARPSSDEGRDLVIPGKRSWSATVDPLFYCFGPRERRALVAGASIKARFGWPAPPAKAAAKKKPSAPAPPFAASPVGAAVGKVSPVKELEAAPFVLADAVAGAVPVAAPAEPSSPGRALLNISMPESRDAARGIEIETTVTVTNDGDQAAILLWRPETVRFSVSGPLGTTTCGTSAFVGSPIRELYSTIGAKGRASMSLLVTAKCPADTFDEPGIFRVTAILDTSNASARTIGLKTWDGEATAKVPMLLRVRAQRRPATSPTRPSLD
ncbi:MAG TPA: hypothetical protein VLT33_01820 [Labilithrix sp.]|nr:hypothetical protein [Labilithrix sp.]